MGRVLHVSIVPDGSSRSERTPIHRTASSRGPESKADPILSSPGPRLAASRPLDSALVGPAVFLEADHLQSRSFATVPGEHQDRRWFRLHDPTKELVRKAARGGSDANVAYESDAAVDYEPNQRPDRWINLHVG